jgi:hypothetical protein
VSNIYVYISIFCIRIYFYCYRKTAERFHHQQSGAPLHHASLVPRAGGYTLQKCLLWHYLQTQGLEGKILTRGSAWTGKASKNGQQQFWGPGSSILGLTAFHWPQWAKTAPSGCTFWIHITNLSIWYSQNSKAPEEYNHLKRKTPNIPRGERDGRHISSEAEVLGWTQGVCCCCCCLVVWFCCCLFGGWTQGLHVLDRDSTTWATPPRGRILINLAGLPKEIRGYIRDKNKIESSFFKVTRKIRYQKYNNRG